MIVEEKAPKETEEPNLEKTKTESPKKQPQSEETKTPEKEPERRPKEVKFTPVKPAEIPHSSATEVRSLHKPSAVGIFHDFRWTRWT